MWTALTIVQIVLLIVSAAVLLAVLVLHIEIRSTLRNQKLLAERAEQAEREVIRLRAALRHNLNKSV